MKHFHQLTIAEIRRETPDAVSILFDVPAELRETFRYRQGQHITLRREIDGEELRRCYSICEAAQDQKLRIAVKKIADGRFSGFANAALKPGDVLDVMPPAGRFYTELSPDAEKNYLAFAGGSGVTPIISLAKTTLRAEPKSRFTLVYGNRDAASIIFLEEIAALKDAYMGRFEAFHILERGQEDIPALQGLVDENKCGELFDQLIFPREADEIFICGPQPMMDAVERALLDCGVGAESIHIERFISGPDEPPRAARRSVEVADADRVAEVSVLIDGQRTIFNYGEEDGNLLDAARRAGVDAPFACKGGVCCTCRAKLLEGQVTMAKNYGLEPDEVAAGYVLTCQSTPQTETIALSFDE